MHVEKAKLDKGSIAIGVLEDCVVAQTDGQPVLQLLIELGRFVDPELLLYLLHLTVNFNIYFLDF